jgi:hypothetical protein
MEENKRLRNLVHASETTPLESHDAAGLSTVSDNLYPSSIGPAVSSLGEASWQVPSSKELEGVQVDGMTIQSLFEQYA